MSNCSKHKRDVAGISDMKELAEMIGDLHYESLALLMHQLFLKLIEDANKDKESGKHELSLALWLAAKHMDNVAISISDAWQISKPFMQE